MLSQRGSQVLGVRDNTPPNPPRLDLTLKPPNPQSPLPAVSEAQAEVTSPFYSLESAKRRGGWIRESLQARVQGLHPQPKPTLGAHGQLRLPAGLSVIRQEPEVQQQQRQDRLHLRHGKHLPDAVPAGGRVDCDCAQDPHLGPITPGTWSGTPQPHPGQPERCREGLSVPGTPMWACVSQSLGQTPAPSSDQQMEKGILSTPGTPLGPSHPHSMDIFP